MTIDASRTHAATTPSFAAVAEELLDDVYGYLLYLTKNWAVAEDLTGETFEAAFKKWRRFDPGRGTPRAWLLAIARSTALDWFRADARRFMDKYGLTYPIVYDGKGSTVGKWGVRGFPETFFVDRSGKLVGERLSGPVDIERNRDAYERGIALALGSKQ